MRRALGTSRVMTATVTPVVTKTSRKRWWMRVKKNILRTVKVRYQQIGQSV